MNALIKVCISMDEWDHIWVIFTVSFVLGQLALINPTEKAQHFQWFNTVKIYSAPG